MIRVRYWFLGFWAGWYSSAEIPPWAWTAHIPEVLAYYRGYEFAQYLKGKR